MKRQWETEELVEHWTLDVEDRVLLGNKTGATRLGFAVLLEFLVAILAGLQHLQDISLAAHPLDKDQAVAQAWGQAAWADYSGVSRRLSWPELGGGQADCPGGGTDQPALPRY